MRGALSQFADEARRLVPEGLDVLDVHAHLGRDEDGRTMDPERLLRQLDRAGIAQACVFPLHDPDRVPAYRRPNDHVLESAAGSGGRLIPFCRLDPLDGAAAEAERCLARGARGIKLHPRAQAFSFGAGDADAVFAIAEQARVPVLIHAGRGMPPIADELCALASRHPGAALILAHAGMADLATFAARLAEHPAVLYDTSAFGPLDVLELFARVAPERIVFGSDPPYGRPDLGLYVTQRVAAAAGLDAARRRALLGGTARTALAGQPLPPPSAPARPRTVTLPGALSRLVVYAGAAFAALVRGDSADAREHLDLARSVCRDPDPGQAGPALARAARALDEIARAIETPGERVPAELAYLVMALAATEPPV